MKFKWLFILFLVLLIPVIYAGTLHVDGNLWVWEKLKINNYYMPLLDGNANQYITTDGDGNLTWTSSLVIDSFELTESVEEDLRFPVNAIKVASDFPPNITAYTLDFRANRIEQAYIIAQMPHSRDTDTNLSAHFHYQTENNNAGDIVWGVEYSCASIHGSFPDFNTLTTVSSSVEDSTVHIMSEGITIPATTLGISAICKVRIFRDPTDERDTYIGSARLLEFDIHYYVNKLGEDSSK